MRPDQAPRPAASLCSLILLIGFLSAALFGCAPAISPGPAATQGEPAESASTKTPAPILETGGQPAPAPSATATGTQAPTATRTASPTPTPTATATPLHPLSIEYLRQQDYSGSAVVIEEQLASGANYDRYIASYRSEGLKIRALLTIPWGEKPPGGWPVIIFNHGFIPPDVYRTTERYVAYVDALATNGYIVFRSDYRGHDQSEGEARGAYGNPDYVIDVLNATAAMKNFPEADPQRIGHWGHSMGGYITLRSMVVDEDIKAGVIWAGVVTSYEDLFEHWFRRPTATPDPSGTSRGRGRWRGQLIESFGTPAENPEFWALLSANSYLEDISGPLQIHHGTADTSVPLVLSEILAGELRALDKLYEFYIYEGDDHNLAQSFSLAMTRSIQFFNAYLKGEPAP